VTAILRATEGPSTGSEFWISEEVFRIGSGDGADWRLPELEPHALTVQFRRGQYFVANRGSLPLLLDGDPVPPGRSAAWKVDQELRVGSTVVWLWSDGDSAPSPQPRLFDDTAEDEAAEDEAAPAPAPKRTRLVLSLALGASLIFAWASSPSRQTDDGGLDRQFDSLVLAIENSVSAEDPLLGSLRPTLQEARVSEVRRQDKTALGRYQAARDLLLARKLPETGYLTGIEQQAAAFVESRLLEIEDR
jgi:hypothetical protein